jgi:hypothetical protein
MDLFINGDCEKSFQKAIRNIKQTGYISHDIIDKYSREIKEDFVNNYIQRLKGLSNIHRFYIFLFEEAIRKYFMQEVRIERYYVNTLTPYFDEEFLELILRTPFAGIYKSEGRKNLFSRRDSQIFYAKIIQTAKPALGDIITDRGYKPNELLLPFIIKAFKIGSAYLQEKTIRSLKGNDVFRSELWSKNMVEKYIYKIGNNDDIFTDRLTQGFNIGLNLKGDFRFFSFFSLRLWLYLLRNNL